jgi:hypothetical protein
MFLRGLFEDPAYRMRCKFGLFDEIEGAEGGAGGGEVIPEGSEGDPSQPAQVTDGGQPGQRDPGAQGRPARPQMIPYGRFQEVNRGYQAYRQFGSPADIKARLERLERLEKNPVNRYTPDQEAEIKADILRFFPQLQRLEENDELQKTQYVNQGSRQNGEFCKQLGWEVNDNNKQLVEDILSSVIGRTPELRERFYARDPAVFTDVFKLVRPTLAPRRTVPGLSVVGNKTTPKAGGPQGKKPGEAVNEANKPKPGSPLFERDVLSEAGDAAFDLITSREE